MGNRNAKGTFHVQDAMRNENKSVEASSASGDRPSDAAKPELAVKSGGTDSGFSTPEKPNLVNPPQPALPAEKEAGKTKEAEVGEAFEGKSDQEERGDTVTIEKIEEVVVVISGPEGTTIIQQVEYDVSEPDGESKGDGRMKDFGDFDGEPRVSEFVPFSK